MTLEKLGEWNKAFEFYEVADRLTGASAPLAMASALLNLAHTHFAIGKFRETVLLCDRVLAISEEQQSLPFVQSASRLAANAYQELGEPNKEAEYLTRFLELADKESAESEAVRRRIEEISNE